MAKPGNKDRTHNIALMMVGVVILAIIIITVLTITAIINGPPTV